MKKNKPEDFVGWCSQDGKLTVIGIADQKTKTGLKLYKVICSICSKDLELYPDGYFIATKNNLLKGSVPCGCSVRQIKTAKQMLILSQRANKTSDFDVISQSGEYKGNMTKFMCICKNNSQHKWSPSFASLVNAGIAGCPYCNGKHNYTEDEAKEKCVAICKENSYEFIGFPSGYKNNLSLLNYDCSLHGRQEVRFHNFVTVGNRCPKCAPRPVVTKEEATIKCEDICKSAGYTFIGFVPEYSRTYKTKVKFLCPHHGEQTSSYKHFVNQGTRCKECVRTHNLYGYYIDKAEENDSLYVIDFGGKYIKVGRSFNIKRRLKDLQKISKIPEAAILYVYRGTHRDVFTTEQEIHNKLRQDGFQYYVDWSTEIFKKESLSYIEDYLRQSILIPY